MKLTKIKIQIKGVHCKSCKTLIESEVQALPGIKKIALNYQTTECVIKYDPHKISKQKIFSAINRLNYKVAEENNVAQKVIDNDKKFSRWITAGILGVLFAIGYLVIKQSGWLEILSKLNQTDIGYGLIFLIGLLASFHCVGMCGGIVVAYTSHQHVRTKKKKNNFSAIHLQYNIGRLISYTVIGGILGGIGSFFAINPNFNGIILIIASLLMVLMGLSLLTRFKWLNKIKLSTPQFIARFLYRQRHTDKPKAPFIIGLINGFMPCGPLQAMQLYALASGSISQGALSMAFYALGTIPLLFGLGGFISLISQDKIKQIIKFSGLIVIILGLIMFNRGLINFGYGFKGFLPHKQTSQNEFLIRGDVEEYQVINMDLTYKGYEPNVLYIKKGLPVRWVINVKQMSSCTDEIIMPDYNINKELEYGENIIEFTPQDVGEIKFSCWMKMVWGKFIVTEEEVDPNQQQLELESNDLPQGSCSATGSCGGSCGSSSCSCRIKNK